MDNDSLREERDRLLDENTKMNTKAATKDDSSIVRYLRSKVSSIIKATILPLFVLYLLTKLAINSSLLFVRFSISRRR